MGKERTGILTIVAPCRHDPGDTFASYSLPPQGARVVTGTGARLEGNGFRR